MLAFTLIFRHSDALALSADVEGVASTTNTNMNVVSSTSSTTSNNNNTTGPDPATLSSFKNTAKNVLRRLSPGAQGGAHSSNYFSSNNNNNNNSSASLVQIEIPNEATFVVLLERGILFLTVNCVKGTPGSPSSSGAVNLAAAYLEEVSREFCDQYGEQALSASRPFMFMRFDNFLSKTKKLYNNQQQRAGIMSNSSSISGNNSNTVGSSSQNNLLLRRHGAVPPTKISFFKLMGLVEPQGYSVDGSGASGSNLFSSASAAAAASFNTADAKNSLEKFVSSLSKMSKKVPGAKNLSSDAILYLSLGVGIILFTLLALYVVFSLFG